VGINRVNAQTASHIPPHILATMPQVEAPAAPEVAIPAFEAAAPVEVEAPAAPVEVEAPAVEVEAPAPDNVVRLATRPVEPMAFVTTFGTYGVMMTSTEAGCVVELVRDGKVMRSLRVSLAGSVERVDARVRRSMRALWSQVPEVEAELGRAAGLPTTVAVVALSGHALIFTNNRLTVEEEGRESLALAEAVLGLGASGQWGHYQLCGFAPHPTAPGQLAALLATDDADADLLGDREPVN